MDNPPVPPAASPCPDERPPIYSEDGDPNGKDPEEVVQPAVFVLHGRFVYAETAAGEADSEPLYQLSRAIHAQGRSTLTINFDRLDYRVRTAANGSPAVSKREKELYRIEARLPFTWTFEVRLVPLTRKALGEVQITKSPIFHHGYRAVKVLSDAQQRALERQGKKPKKGEYYFALKEHGKDTWLWTDPDGVLVASQVSGIPSGGEGVEHKLRVMVPLTRRTLDGLVAMWCSWMWHLHNKANIPKKTWEDRQQANNATTPDVEERRALSIALRSGRYDALGT
ncbi:hypothetical protein MFIFM68171_08606 [Madurella fahalii]|uniref:Uncharacterized protein n=1 Tax=Madurella fahalii TaxID=1157608 RepID=A0ABQ0GL12_9PEZI